MSRLFNKYVVILVLVALLFATGIRIHSGLAAPPGSDWNSKNLSRIDRSKNEFSFIVFGDNKNSIGVFNNLIKHVNGETAAFALDDGDLVFDGEMPKYRFFVDQVKKLNKPLLTAIGNHETYENGRGNYYDIFGPFYYSFTVGRSYFIVLDNANEDSIDSWQMDWLTSELEKSKDYQYRFVFMHVPLFDRRTRGFGLAHAMKNRADARRINALLDNYGVTMVFASHIHEYERGVWGKTPYIITGGAGGELAGTDPKHYFFHYVKVKVTNAGVTYDVVRLKTPTTVLERLAYDTWIYVYAFLAVHYLDLVIVVALIYLLVFALYWLEKREGWLADLRKSKNGRPSEKGAPDEEA